MYCTSILIKKHYTTKIDRNIIFVPIHSLPKHGGTITKSYIYMMMEILDTETTQVPSSLLFERYHMDIGIKNRFSVRISKNQNQNIKKCVQNVVEHTHMSSRYIKKQRKRVRGSRRSRR